MIGSSTQMITSLTSDRHLVSVHPGCVALQIKPLEEAYKFGSFFSSLLSESDFEAKPSVLLLGQYSTGKTTFIKHLLGRDYPGIHIGPEPTTGDCCLSAAVHVEPANCMQTFCRTLQTTRVFLRKLRHDCQGGCLPAHLMTNKQIATSSSSGLAGIEDGSSSC